MVASNRDGGFCPLFILSKGAKDMKIKRPEWHCKNCVWLNNENLCMFVRCVRHEGFVADKKTGGAANGNK